MPFIIEEIPPKKLQGDWRDLYRIPWDLFKAFFWFTPKAIIAELGGKEVHAHEDEVPIDDRPGWQPMGIGWPEGLERHYFEAEKEFADTNWHAVDGYRLRHSAFPEALETIYFEGKSIFAFENGVVGQQLRRSENDSDCPLLFVDVGRKTIEVLLELDGPAHITEEGEMLMIERPQKRWKLHFQQ
ncbi:MAG: hypothetical protein R3B47_13125 [Bacteroidia bacterium]